MIETLNLQLQFYLKKITIKLTEFGSCESKENIIVQSNV